jgi:hypothetical protein
LRAEGIRRAAAASNGSRVFTASGHEMLRRFRVRTTDSHHDLRVAPNLLEQTFVATA